jgi:hypothetical protein
MPCVVDSNSNGGSVDSVRMADAAASRSAGSRAVN